MAEHVRPLGTPTLPPHEMEREREAHRERMAKQAAADEARRMARNPTNELSAHHAKRQAKAGDGVKALARQNRQQPKAGKHG